MKDVFIARIADSLITGTVSHAGAHSRSGEVPSSWNALGESCVGIANRDATIRTALLVGVKGKRIMPDILIRGLKPETIRLLKLRAKRHDRSLQNEVRLLLEQATENDTQQYSTQQIAAMFDRWQRRFAGRKFSSNVRPH